MTYNMDTDDMLILLKSHQENIDKVIIFTRVNILETYRLKE